MSAMDELCRLLSERGAEYEVDGYGSCLPTQAWWRGDGCASCTAEEDGDVLRVVTRRRMTPEQAVDVTLGTEIVHCKDCEYAMYDAKYCRCFTDDENCVAVDPDGFCAWGRRWGSEILREV